jgi:predicted AlkP superfamily pyrophosphatase or phosphodiesterase
MLEKNLALIFAAIGSFFASESYAAALRQPAEPYPRVLIIGLDGVRLDALLAAHTPTLDSLRREGAFSSECHGVMPARSGPGWTTLLTGVTVKEHGAGNNTLQGWRPAQAPALPTLAKQAGYPLRVAAITHWHKFSILMFDADTHLDFRSDIKVERAATEELQREDAGIVFAHFDDSDKMGHRFGFSPNMPPYIWAIESHDRRIARLCTQLRRRPNFTNENWLVAVVTDHGGNGRRHGSNTLSDRRVFMILNGFGIRAKQDLGRTDFVDLMPTVFAHLGLYEGSRPRFAGQVRGLETGEAPRLSRN